MAKLTYWVARQHDDRSCYNIIGKTRKAVLEEVAKNTHVKYEAPEKVELYYKDAFDLFAQATGEGGGRG